MSICLVTRCAKGLMNGPCGGVIDGARARSRDGDHTTDKGWALNYRRLIWTLESISNYFQSRSIELGISDIEMALFIMGK